MKVRTNVCMNFLMFVCCLCRIGTEHEKFGFERKTLRSINYEQLSALLNGIAERFDWEKIMEGDNIIGLRNVSPRLISFSL